MADPYSVLGVTRDASEEEIRKSYRRLAKEFHPDLRPGDAAAEKRFKEITAAYDVIGDAEKRARFDRGEIDETGAERPQHDFYRHYAEGEPGFRYHTGSGFGEAEDLGDIFADLFGRRRADMPMRGADLRYTLAVDFLEAANGAKRSVQMPDGKTLSLSIPAGLRDGQTLRLRGQGQPGHGGGPPGDTLVDVHVRPHPLFRRDGDDIRVVLPVTLAEAVLGASVKVETVTGPVNLKIPKGANSGQVLRLRGKGLRGRRGGKQGDQLVELRVSLPAEPDPELERFVRDWEAKRPYNPRAARGADR